MRRETRLDILGKALVNGTANLAIDVAKSKGAVIGYSEDGKVATAIYPDGRGTFIELV